MSIEEISVKELHALGPDVQVVDVREDDEWVSGRVPHAVHIPLGTVPDRVDAFDGAPTYVICRSGGRSMQVCEFLAAQGLSVVNVAGGTLAWIDAGFDLQSGADG